MFEYILNLDPIVQIPISAILGYLGGKLVEILIGNYRDNRQEYRTAYAKFAQAFSLCLQRLEMADADLNSLILDEFPKHDLARLDFDHYLNGSRKRRFRRKWAEYAEKYYELKDMGAAAKIAAIAPPDADLEAIQKSPEAMIRAMTNWYLDRRNELYLIIRDLLRMCKP